MLVCPMSPILDIVSSPPNNSAETAGRVPTEFCILKGIGPFSVLRFGRDSVLGFGLRSNSSTKLECSVSRRAPFGKRIMGLGNMDGSTCATSNQVEDALRSPDRGFVQMAWFTVQNECKIN